jgi:hypothetical protein
MVRVLAICSIPGEQNKKDPFRQRKKYSTKLEDLEYLPLDMCREFLRVRFISPLSMTNYM